MQGLKGPGLDRPSSARASAGLEFAVLLDRTQPHRRCVEELTMQVIDLVTDQAGQPPVEPDPLDGPIDSLVFCQEPVWTCSPPRRSVIDRQRP